MNAALKKVLSKRGIAIVLAILLALTGLNTYLILVGTQQANVTNVVAYDFVLSQNGGGYQLKNALTGYVSEPASASSAINAAMAAGNSVYLNAGTYQLTEDVYITNKQNAKIVGDGATIEGNGYKIVIYGDNYTTSQYATVSGLTIINGTIRIENSFAATITDSKFINSTVGIEFANTNTWSEYSKVENCQFINDSVGIAFRTPVNGTIPGIGGNATGSYSSSIIERCSFNLQDNQIGINVERLAELSDSQIQDVRFWAGEDGEGSNQTALRDDGSMYQTLLFGVVFESFTSNPRDMYAVDLGKNCDPAPILDGGVSFLGNWTAMVHNPYAIWISGVGSVFQRSDVSVPVGVNGQYGGNVTIEDKPLKIFNFKPQVTVKGGFSQNETITVRIRILYIDNSVSNPVTRTFTSSGSAWLSDDEMMQLYSSQSIIWAILVDAKVNTVSSDASVSVSGYGTAG